ncbi:MIEF1 upstream open reading frame protein [Contarinia nasturtii]|uniref:MIEF1 upstream open reading frame protein n=1 Tax=Contarinia nasturtii TaxID=265458 RepID=UPI0012D458FF|nr:MIEF1 upstream open reading frame protein [Contarinia nasturtii]
MNAATNREVLQLYRKLLRYGKELKFTDQSYFRRRVRKEFILNKDLESQADIEFQIKRGEALLQRKRVV